MHCGRYEPCLCLIKQSKLQRVRRHFFAIWQRRWKPGIAIEDCEPVCDAECPVQNSPQVTKAEAFQLHLAFVVLPSYILPTSTASTGQPYIFQICTSHCHHSHDSILPSKLEKKGVGHLQPCMCVDQQSNGLRFKFTSSTESLIP